RSRSASRSTRRRRCPSRRARRPRSSQAAFGPWINPPDFTSQGPTVPPDRRRYDERSLHLIRTDRQFRRPHSHYLPLARSFDLDILRMEALLLLARRRGRRPGRRLALDLDPHAARRDLDHARLLLRDAVVLVGQVPDLLRIAEHRKALGPLQDDDD